MSDILDDNEDYQEDIEQVEDDEVIDDEQDVDDSQDDEQDDDSADDVLEFSFDDEDGDSEDDKDPYAGQEAPQWVKDTRRRAKEVERENRRLKQQLEQRNSQSEPQQALREKPTLDAHEYDSDAYEQDVQQWFIEKQQHDVQVQAEQQKYKQYHDRYKADVEAIKEKAPDYDEVELSVVDVLSNSQQGLLQMAVDNPARMVYALGKNSPAQLEKLSKLNDVQFVKQIALLEQQMASKSKSRNPNKPKPKTHELEGAAGGADTRLAKLEAEAAKTGDRSKVIAYKRNQK